MLKQQEGEIMEGKQAPIRRGQIIDINQEPLLQAHHPTSVAPPPPVLMSEKIDVQRLRGTNWPSWKWQITNLLESKEILDVLTSQEPKGSRREVATRNILSSSLDYSLICKVVHC